MPEEPRIETLTRDHLEELAWLAGLGARPRRPPSPAPPPPDLRRPRPRRQLLPRHLVRRASRLGDDRRRPEAGAGREGSPGRLRPPLRDLPRAPPEGLLLRPPRGARAPLRRGGRRLGQRRDGGPDLAHRRDRRPLHRRALLRPASRLRPNRTILRTSPSTSSRSRSTRARRRPRSRRRGTPSAESRSRTVRRSTATSRRVGRPRGATKGSARSTRARRPGTSR